MKRVIFLSLVLLAILTMSASAEDMEVAYFEGDTMKEQTNQVRIFRDLNSGEFKAYMDYRTITDTTSEQWALQQKAYTGRYGIRQMDGYFCVAMGSNFGTKIGQKYTLEMANGKRIPVILADQKADADTDPSHMYDQLGGIVEFIVDEERMSSLAKKMGDISYSDYEFYGPIKNIVVGGLR